MKAKTSRPSLESLENRDTPAVAANLTNGVLTVLGTGNADNIAISQRYGRVWLSGQSSDGSLAQNFLQTTVSQIVVVGSHGNDTITLAWGVTIPSRIFGGYGNDLIYSGSGNDVVYGGEGNDTIYSRPGNDVVFGGAGTDILSDTIGTNTLVAGAPFRSYALSSMESQILSLVNNERTSRGLSALTLNSKLNFGARTHSSNMASRSESVGDFMALEHNLYGTTTPTSETRAAIAGYENWTLLGENIAFGYADAATVMNGWMNSSGHRANILNAGYTEIGISVVYNSRGVPFYTQLFGSRS